MSTEEKVQEVADKKQDDLMQPIKSVEACIEAIVFAAGYPVPYQKLAEVIGIGVREVKRMVERIAKTYQNDKHGIMLLTFDKACQFCTKEQYGTYIREALGIRRGGNLSASSMEVLAVVAYNQPVTRAFIDAVRGVDSNYAVNSLIDKELIAATGRLDAPGRPLLYGTTEKFLRETMLPDNGAGDQLSIAVEEQNGDGEEAEPVDDAQLTLDDAPTAEPSESTDSTEETV